MRFDIELAEPSDSADIGRMIFKMDLEIWSTVKPKSTEKAFVKLSERMLLSGRDYWAFIARDMDGALIGLITLNENSSIYAGGRYGDIAEFYVDPDYRSQGLGAELMKSAIAFGNYRQWKLLTATTPKGVVAEDQMMLHQKFGFQDFGNRLELHI